MRRTSILLTLLLLLLCITTLQAAPARRGWIKLELSAVDGRSGPAPAALLARFESELIADYGAYAIVAVPKGIVTALEAQARKENIRVRQRDELDLLQLPGATVDAREGIHGVAAEQLIREYPAGRAGVYVLQLAGPVRAEWTAELQALGWKLSRYIPHQAYLAVGPPELVTRTRQLAFVQWLDFYHPYQKASHVVRDGVAREHLFELVEGDASASGIEAIRAAADGEIEVRQNAYDTRVYARMDGARAEALLRHETILGVGPRPFGGLSDERQVMSLTSNLNAAQTAPTNPGEYWNWVLSRCPTCGDMPASAWKIGIADTGVDNGINTDGHPDLNGRKFFGGAIYPAGDAHDLDCGANILCDDISHGTAVAGIAAGNAATGFLDATGFRLGTGTAPTAGVFATKIMSFDSATKRGNGAIDGSLLFRWAADAVAGGATVQNHSWNEYLSTNAGSYSALSRDYDIATRDADGSISTARVPMLFTVSSGNHNQGDQDPMKKYLTLAGATAKNVLSMGGLENSRPEQNGIFACRNHRGDGFNNIMRTSRIGTQDPGYFKPDLMAPASLVVSAYSRTMWGAASTYCLGDFLGHREYTGDSGTSFAAPVGAGAALIVKRYLGNTAADVSPALSRAVLIAGARSVRDGVDRTHPTPSTITAVPSQQQGFGRLSLDDILNGAAKPVVFDQHATRTFTAAGQSFTTTVRVRDSAKPVKIALVWSDAPGTPGVNSPLVNDLQLEVRRSSDASVVYVGNSLSVLDPARGEESVAFPAAGTLTYDGKNNVEYFRLFVNPGEDLTMTVKAWNIAGNTDATPATFEQDFALAILNAQTANCTAGVITQQPQSQTIVPDTTATLSVTVTGSGPFNFQWFRAASGVEQNPVGTNSPSFTTGPLTATTSYWVRVTDECTGTVLPSATATITVQCTAAPSITQQPASRVTNPNESTTLSVSATQAVSYQWYLGASPSTASPIAGATASTLTVNPGSTTNYWVRVTNACGVANSATATVCVLPAITAHPPSRTINLGQSTTLTVTAVNAASFQWYSGASPSTANPIAGATSTSLTVTPNATTSYWVRVTNSCGFVNSNTVTVTVIADITRRQSAFALANSQTSITASWTQPTQAGNFLAAVISGRKDPNGSVVWTAPAGWQLAVVEEWNFVKTAIYYLPNNAGGRTSETFTVAAGFHDMTLYLMEYANVATVNPLDRTGHTGDDTNNGYVQTGFTANTTQPKELVLTALTTYTMTAFTTVPADGYAELFDKSIGNRLTTAAYEKITTTIGSYGHGASVGVPAEWVGVVATFKAAN